MPGLEKLFLLGATFFGSVIENMNKMLVYLFILDFTYSHVIHGCSHICQKKPVNIQKGNYTNLQEST